MILAISALLSRENSSLSTGNKRRKLFVMVSSIVAIASLSTLDIVEGEYAGEEDSTLCNEDLTSDGRCSKIKSTVECEPCPEPKER